MTYKLSPSSLNLMGECPRCFWLTQHKVWKRPAGIFPSLPSGMDKILKIHFDRFMEKGKLPPEICENGHCESMKLFDDKELLKIWQSNFKGISWTDEEGNNLHGAVDNILVKGKKLIVLDYKTRGYALKEDTADHYQNQLDFYNFLLRKNDYETEDYAFLLFYVPKEVTKTGEVIFDTELVKMKVDVGNAESIFVNAIKLLNSECPDKGCEWCERIKDE
ncbi:PD-(D/E)XK nuclease family protein [archaeon]|nr:PD-(D/E)XK nuclease family protein [archaeon]